VVKHERRHRPLPLVIDLRLFQARLVDGGAVALDGDGVGAGVGADQVEVAGGVGGKASALGATQAQRVGGVGGEDDGGVVVGGVGGVDGFAQRDEAVACVEDVIGGGDGDGG